MTPVADLSRRQLLHTAGVATAAAAAGFGIGRYTATNGTPTATNRTSFVLDSRLQALVASGRFSPELGDAFLGEGSPRSLAAYEASVEATLRSLPEGDLEAGIRRATAHDFATGNICSVDGWQLSLTECRLAAIAWFFRENSGHIQQPEPNTGPLDIWPDAQVADVERWGPQSTGVGEPFNRRPDGGSSVWLHVRTLPEFAVYEVYLGGQPAETFVNRTQKLISGSLTVEQARPLIAGAGRIPLHLVDPVRGKQLVGYIRVRPRPLAPEPADPPA